MSLVLRPCARPSDMAHKFRLSCPIRNARREDREYASSGAGDKRGRDLERAQIFELIAGIPSLAAQIASDIPIHEKHLRRLADELDAIK